MIHEELIKNVMTLLLKGDLVILKDLRKQYKNAQIKSIESTGVGFYINFEIHDINSKLQITKDSFNFGDVYGTYNNIFGAVGFVLFIQNGYISCLEGYSNTGENWPSNDNDIKLCYDTQGIRDIPSVLKLYDNK